MKVGIAYPAFKECFEDLLETEITDISFYYETLDDTKMLKILFELDLVIFSGGEDISPGVYGQENTHSSGINIKRDQIEIKILELSRKIDAKILGVCRGHQIINAFFGGNLCQDIFLSGKKYHESIHNLDWKYFGYMSKNFKTVNSLHHQGVISPGYGFSPVAYKDEIIEATIYKNKFFSVQWHPEFMTEKFKDFKNLINSWVEEKNTLFDFVSSSKINIEEKERQELINEIRSELQTDFVGVETVSTDHDELYI